MNNLSKFTEKLGYSRNQTFREVLVKDDEKNFLHASDIILFIQPFSLHHDKAEQVILALDNSRWVYENTIKTVLAKLNGQTRGFHQWPEEIEIQDKCYQNKMIEQNGTT